jgi:hypothetical protein
MNVKAANTVWFVRGWEQDLFEALPHPAFPIVLCWSINILDVIDTHSTRPQVVEPEAGLDEISTAISVFDLERHPKSPKPPL